MAKDANRFERQPLPSAHTTSKRWKRTSIDRGYRLDGSRSCLTLNGSAFLDRSRLIGEAMRYCLPDVLPLLDPFPSTEDIEKGAKWNKVISGALKQSDVAIIGSTPEN